MTSKHPQQLELAREQYDLPELITGAGPRLERVTLDWLVSGRRTAHETRLVYARALRRFADWWQDQGLGLRRLSEPGAAELIDRYLREIAVGEGALSASSVRKELSALRTWIDHLVGEGLLLTNPAHAVDAPPMPAPADRKHIPEVTPGAVRKLVESVSGPKPIDLRDKAMILTMLYAGVRAGALANLRTDDLKLGHEGSILQIRKRGKLLEIPLHRRALEALLRWICVRTGEANLAATGDLPQVAEHVEGVWELFAAAKTPLFVSFGRGRGRGEEVPGDGPLTRQIVHGVVARRARAAGILHAVPQGLRASFASRLLEQGADLMQVRDLMGHADVSTTAIYDRRRKDGRGAVELLDW